jgi:hypothetical protein
MFGSSSSSYRKLRSWDSAGQDKVGIGILIWYLAEIWAGIDGVVEVGLLD